MHLLIAAGGHAKVVVEALPGPVAAYVDPHQADWLKAEHIPLDRQAMTSERLRALRIAFAIGGTRPETLESRLKLLEDYLAAGFTAPPIIHPSAIVSRKARIDPGTVVFAGAVVQPCATVGLGSIINTRAVVEHDSAIAAGCHVAPGAIVLGDCAVGRTSMIGAGAVVLPGTRLPDRTLVNSVTRCPK